VFFMGEARFGRQGTLTRMWARKGSRPTAVKQTRDEWLYLGAAVEPRSGASTALLTPYVDAGAVNAFPRMAPEDLDADDHAVMIMDQAGWHVSKKLVIPEDITILPLPPYSPERIRSRISGTGSRAATRATGPTAGMTT
jgi:hypothetical protein